MVELNEKQITYRQMPLIYTEAKYDGQNRQTEVILSVSLIIPDHRKREEGMDYKFNVFLSGFRYALEKTWRYCQEELL